MKQNSDLRYQLPRKQECRSQKLSLKLKRIIAEKDNEKI